MFGDIFDCVEDWLQFCLAQSAVVILTECLQINVYCVEPVGGEVNSFFGLVAIADEDVFQAVLLCQFAAVSGQFHKDGWFGIGIGDAFAAVLNGGVDDLFRAYGFALEFACFDDGLAYLPVLAEFAAEVAAHRRD